jgi:hypothetical protein
MKEIGIEVEKPPKKKVKDHGAKKEIPKKKKAREPSEE